MRHMIDLIEAALHGEIIPLRKENWNWMTLLCEARFKTPKVLYHGTKPTLLRKIKQQGLTAKSDTSWQEFGAGVYLALNVEKAREYGNLVFAVDLSQIDHRNLVPDDHELRDHYQAEDGDEADDEPTGIHEASWLDSLRITSQCQYLGDIPPSALKIIPPRVQPWDGRFKFRIDFQFKNGARETRVFIASDKTGALRQTQHYFDNDTRGTPQITALKNVGRYERSV